VPVRTDPLTGAPEPSKVPTRAQYQTALCTLPRLWPEIIRQHKLAPDDFLALSWLLAQQPGRVLRLAVRVPKESKKPGLAEILGWPRARVNRSLTRLRTAGLVIAVVYRHRKKDQFPFGGRNVPTTNTLRVFVRVDALERFAKNDPSDGACTDPSTGSPRTSDAPTHPNPPARVCRRRTRTGSKASETPSGSGFDGCPIDEPTSSAPEEREAVKEGAQEKCQVAAEPASSENPTETDIVNDLAARWDAEKIPEQNLTVSVCRASERAAIRRALRDVGRERIALAILGTRADAWLRAGHARSAVAWVFRKGNAGVDYYGGLAVELEREAEAKRRATARRRAEAHAREEAFTAAERDRLERAKRWQSASPEERAAIQATFKSPFR
jgi:hypothetical protein